MEFKKVKKRIFKPLKKLDAEIRTLENEQYQDKKVYWSLEVGMVESLGEQGYIHTFFYDECPTDQEIEEDIINHIKEERKKLKEDSFLSYREEQILNKLQKIKI